MKSTTTARPRDTTNSPLDLVIASGLLSPFQVERLRACWPDLDVDLWAQPYFRVVCEHTRAFIKQLHTKEFVEA